MKKNKSIAIIGEGETEWFYLESLRITKRYPFKVQPGFPQHADITHFIKLAEDYAGQGYDYVLCLVDMDRLKSNRKEGEVYRKAKSRYSKGKIHFIETYPCTEFWFLLHFLPLGTRRTFKSCDEILPELRKYIPGYEKTKRFLKRANLFQFLSENGDLGTARKNASRLCELSRSSPEDEIAYSEIHKLFDILDSLTNV